MVSAVVAGDTIRRAVTENSALTLTALTVELEGCARDYTGCANTPEGTFDECVEFVMTRFGWLNIKELREAFRLAAAGELGNVSLAAYHGLFTVGILGNVLAAYKEYRDRISAEVAKAEKEVVYTEVQVLQSTNWDSAGWSERRLKTLLELEEPHHRHFTAYDYDHFTTTGQMPISDEAKLAAWKDAYPIAHAEVVAGALSGNQSLRFFLEKINAGKPDEGFKAKRMVIAKQLLVFRWIEQRRFFESGFASLQLLQAIAEKVRNQTPLSEFENAVFIDKTGAINDLLRIDPLKS